MKLFKHGTFPIYGTVLVYVCVKCGFDLLIVSTEWTNLAFSITNIVEKLIFLMQ